jgi:hypothetical protein
MYIIGVHQLPYSLRHDKNLGLTWGAAANFGWRVIQTAALETQHCDYPVTHGRQLSHQPHLLLICQPTRTAFERTEPSISSQKAPEQLHFRLTPGQHFT